MESDYYGIIYKATCKDTGKIYIGQTILSLEERIRGHLKQARKVQLKHKSYFSRAYSKHGPDAFTWEIIDYAESRQELNEKETHYIYKYDALNREKGYNTAGGGAYGNPFAGKTEEELREIRAYCVMRSKEGRELRSPEQKQAVSRAVSKGIRHYFDSLSPGERERVRMARSARMSSRIITQETREKISRYHRGRKKPRGMIYHHAQSAVVPVPHGVIHISRVQSEPRQPKKSASKTGENNPMYGVYGADNPRSMPIYGLNLKSGLFSEICGIQEASRVTGVPATKICAVLKGRRHTAHGYIFFYK
jgi:group I intron endonuclease